MMFDSLLLSLFLVLRTSRDTCSSFTPVKFSCWIVSDEMYRTSSITILQEREQMHASVILQSMKHFCQLCILIPGLDHNGPVRTQIKNSERTIF